MIVQARVEPLFVVIVAGVVSCVLGAIVIWRWTKLRKHGMPEGVWRLSRAGFRFGAGESKGSLQRWPLEMRTTITTTAAGTVLIKAFYVSRGKTCWSLAGIYARCNDQPVEGIAQRLREWCPGGEVYVIGAG